MHRRDALKKATMGLGYVVATPTILNLLASCNANTESWNPLFLSIEEKQMVTHLADIIIPASDTPGALDVNVAQFIDLIYHEVKTDEEKSLFKDGAILFSEKFKNTFNGDPSTGKKEDFEQLLTTCFNLSDEDTVILFDQQKLPIEVISKEDIKNYTLYKFLLSVRYYSIFGYTTSEKIGEGILAYDPVPGVYNGCIPLDKATNGRAWSL